MKTILALGSAGGLFIAARGSFGLLLLRLVAKKVSPVRVSKAADVSLPKELPE